MDDEAIRPLEPAPEVPIQHQKWTMYWSSLERYEGCPQRFLWGKGWGILDVGGGPGKRKPVPVRSSDHHRVMGVVIADVMDKLYNEQWWAKLQGSELAGKLTEEVYAQFDRQCGRTKYYLPFGSFSPTGQVPSRTEVLNTCVDGVLNYLTTMRANKLVGEFAQAEVNLLGYVNSDNPVGGRCDLLIRRADTGVTILDGKNSMSKGKYTDPDQLRWYALCFYIVYGRLPDRLGFIYYRYPHDPETGEQGVEWVEFDAEDVRGLAVRAVEARRGMYNHAFEPTPDPPSCKFCDYESICEARQQQRAKNAKRRKRKDGELKKDLAAGVPIEGTSLSELDFG